MAPVVVFNKMRAVPDPNLPLARTPTTFSWFWTIPGASLEKLPTVLSALTVALLSRAIRNVTVPVVARRSIERSPATLPRVASTVPVCVSTLTLPVTPPTETEPATLPTWTEAPTGTEIR